MKDLGIVIPAYNEEVGIGKVVDAVLTACPEARLLVVDDCSRDRTAQIAVEHGAETVTNPRNFNYGRALKIGFAHQVAKYEVEYLAFLDADGTYPPEAIPELYRLCKQGGFDMVSGSRFLGHNTGMPPIRKLGNSIFARLISFYSRRRITDTGTGLRVFKRELLPLLENMSDGLDLTPAMTCQFAFQGIKYAEVPIQYGARAGTSHLSNFRDGYRFLRAVLRPTRQFRPLVYWLTLGVPFSFTEWILRLRTGTKPPAFKEPAAV